MKLLTTNPPPKASNANNMLVTITTLYTYLSTMPIRQNYIFGSTGGNSLISTSSVRRVYRTHFTNPQNAYPIMINLWASVLENPLYFIFYMNTPATSDPIACALYPAMLYHPKILAIYVSISF